MAIQANAIKQNTYMRIKGGDNPTPRDYPIAASQVLKRGDPVVFSSGKVTKIIVPTGTATTTLVGASTLMVGIVAQGLTVDASSVSTDGRAVTTVPIIPIDDAELMLGGIGAAGANASKVYTDYTLGTSYALACVTLTAATIWTWAVSTTVTNANMSLIILSEESTTTETYPYMWFNVLRAAKIGA